MGDEKAVAEMPTGFLRSALFYVLAARPVPDVLRTMCALCTCSQLTSALYSGLCSSPGRRYLFWSSAPWRAELHGVAEPDARLAWTSGLLSRKAERIGAPTIAA